MRARFFILAGVVGCGGRPTTAGFEVQVRAALAGRSDYTLESSMPPPTRTLAYPERGPANERVRLRGVFFQETEGWWSAGKCESPYEIDGVAYGSRLGEWGNNTEHDAYWIWVRCEQMVSLAPCQGKYVELIGTYDRGSYAGKNTGGDRVVSITSVRELPGPPLPASRAEPAPPRETPLP